MVEVGAEVAYSLELEAGGGVGGGEAGLKLGGDYFEGAGVDEIFEVGVFVGEGVFLGEEAVIVADFGVNGVAGGNPVDGAFDFASVGRAAAL